MLSIQVLCLAALIGSVNSVCSYTSWEQSFNYKGQSKCNEMNYYIRGLERNNVNWQDDPLDHLEGVECCSPLTQWSNIEQLVIYADWTFALDRDNAWAHCPAGYFLQGLYRSDSEWPWYKGYLNHLENARCVKPATHPSYYGDCYIEDISQSFDRKGRVSCRENYYINGLYRGNGDDLYNLDRLSCCSMVEKPQPVFSADDLKSNIMEKSIWNIANLAYFLGYGGCYGIGALNAGEDFHRNGDTWSAGNKLFFGQSCSDNHKCFHRLNIEFGDWSLAVKEIKYGKPIHDSLEPETLDSGEIINNEATKVTKKFEKSSVVQETFTHTTTSNWKNSHELSLSLNFKLSDKVGLSFSYTTNFEYSTSTTNQQEKMNSTTMTTTTSKTLEPFSAAKFRVMVSKTRTTIPYTAVIITKFSTLFKGFLRWGGGYGSSTTNFHYQYKGNGDHPTVDYRFGSKSVPFFAALKEQSESQYLPWLWNEVFKNYPSARHVVNRLTDETQYEFTLSGTLEQVAGSRIDILWETANITKREVPVDSSNFVNGTFLAKVGPNDPPAKVEYPVISLKNAEPFKLEPIPVNENSKLI